MVRKLLEEALQVDREGVLARDVVHAEEVVHSLIRLQIGQEVRRDAKVLPADLPLNIL